MRSQLWHLLLYFASWIGNTFVLRSCLFCFHLLEGDIREYVAIAHLSGLPEADIFSCGYLLIA